MIVKRLLNSDKRFLLAQEYGLTNFIPDELYLRRMFKATLHKELDLNNPQTFNEKLQWLKLHDRRPEYTNMVDKSTVKEYVGKTIGEQYLIQTLGVWEQFDDIDFNILPNSFVLKCTHDSGGVIVVRNKNEFDKNIARKILSKSLKRNFFYYGREWPYKNVPPRIIAEDLLEDSDSIGLNDYKLMCFNGKVQCSFVCTQRFSTEGMRITFFDREWNVLPFERHYKKSAVEIQKPKNYEKMLDLAEKLSKGIPFVRVDFYEVSGRIYFGELTFFPGSGFEEFTPECWDKILGDWIELPVARNML